LLVAVLKSFPPLVLNHHDIGISTKHVNIHPSNNSVYDFKIFRSD
jgi:hypothetical protein